MAYMKHALLLFCCLLSLAICIAQQNETNTISVEIRIDSSNGVKVDSVKLKFATEYYPGNEKAVTHTLFPGAGSVFSLIMKVPDKTGIIGFYIYDQEKSGLINDAGEFFTAPGDAISITLKKEGERYSGVFTGKGSSKYNCKSEMVAQRDIFHGKGTGFVDSTEKVKAQMDTCIYRSMQFVDSCKTWLEPAIYQLLTAETQGYFAAQWMANVIYYYQGAATEKARREILNAYRSFPVADTFSDKAIASLSTYYLIYQLGKCQFDLLVQSNNKGYHYRSLYEYIKSAYNGLMRERLLLVCLENYRSFRYLVGFHPEEYMTCVEDARKIVRDAYMVECLQALLLFRRGEKVYNFSLPDQQNRIVSLDSLSGNVVLLDVWGDGCSGCAAFYRKMKNAVYPRFKDHPDFKVVSISINNTKEGWIKGINTGRYTDNEHINLFTEGKGIEHPFTQYYRLRSVPFILLIDKKGRIYAKIEIGLEDEKIIALINEALAAS
jgi:thioredoxin-related protein